MEEVENFILYLFLWFVGIHMRVTDEISCVSLLDYIQVISLNKVNIIV